ncbi:hypothetical protein Ancab_040239 [Ancistrocladus abbreviatus]
MNFISNNSALHCFPDSHLCSFSSINTVIDHSKQRKSQGKGETMKKFTASSVQQSTQSINNQISEQRLNDAIVPVELSPGKVSELEERFRYALFAKVLHKKVNRDQLYRHILHLWAPVGTLEVFQLVNDFFVIVFSNPLDYSKVVNGVPWKIAGHYITLHPFVHNFRPSEATIGQTAIWIRLREFPIELYDEEVYHLIALALGGRLLKIDCVTQTRSKVEFARLCCVLDLRNALPRYLQIGNLLQKIEYEGLGDLCDCCRHVGHLQHECTLYPLPDLKETNPFPGGYLQTCELVPTGSIYAAITEESPYNSRDESTTPEDKSSSSTILKEATTRHLSWEPQGEGTSSSASNLGASSKVATIPFTAKKPLDHEKTYDAARGENKELNSYFVMPLAAPDSTMVPLPKVLKSNSVQQPTEPKIVQLPHTDQRNPQPLCPKLSVPDPASKFFSQVVQRSTKHGEITSESIQLIPMNTEPIVLTIESGISNIQMGISTSQSPNCKAMIQVKPTKTDKKDSLIAPCCARKILGWTCRGAGDPKVTQALKDLIQAYKPSILFLSGTRLSGFHAHQLIDDLDFYDSHCVDSVGFLDGMWLLWHKDVKVVVQVATSEHISAAVDLITDQEDSCMKV